MRGSTVRGAKIKGKCFFFFFPASQLLEVGERMESV